MASAISRTQISAKRWRYRQPSPERRKARPIDSVPEPGIGWPPMTNVNAAGHTYRLVQDWAKLPPGDTFGIVSAVATDSQDRVYAFQRKDPPVVIFDTQGNYTGAWGIGAIADPHGLYIEDDIAYV